MTNLCIALYCILLYCVILNCIVLLTYCYVDIIQYNAMHKFVGLLDNPLYPYSGIRCIREILQYRGHLQSYKANLELTSGLHVSLLLSPLPAFILYTVN